MKKLILFALLFTEHAFSQSSIIIGVQGNISKTGLLNREDRNAAAAMLDKKNGIQGGYGVRIGYRIKKRIRITLEPNYLQYKISYSGKSDTANVRSFDASARFKYYQIPLMINYQHSISNRINLFAGVGFSFNYLNYYKEEFEGIQVPLGIPSSQGSRVYYFFTGKMGYAEATALENKWNMELSHSKYVNKTYSFCFNFGTEYALSDKVGMEVNIMYQRGITDMEYKGVGTEKSTDLLGNTATNTFNYWNETNYLRYYYRYPEKYNQRKETFTMALGLGLGINYHFNGGLLSKKQND